MIEKSRKFLEELLMTYSPSGSEENFQNKWIEYVKEYADEIRTDLSGNAIGIINPEADFKVLLAGHADEISFIVNYIDDNGFIYVQKSGGINPKLALGKRVKVLGTKEVYGAVGVVAEHQGGAKDKLKVSDIFIDVGASSKKDLEGIIRVGDFVVYDVSYKHLMNNNIVARGLDNKTGSFIVAEVIRELSKENIDIGVYSVSTVSEETIKNGAYFAASQIKPDIAIAVDVTFATDYPGMNKCEHGDVKLGNGPVISMGSPINKVVNNIFVETAKEEKISLQYELTPAKTGTDADQLRVTGKGVATALMSLPLRYMHSPSEVVNMIDIENEIKLLVGSIKKIKRDIDLKPLGKNYVD
ncbi:MAG: M42 family peptidase [Bacillota bacterium]|nr:M42 family peptidase [Bacillota bacterium]